MNTELLSPAGTLKSMRYAFAYGADAVYVGQPRYSLRVRNNEFHRIENLALAAEEARSRGKKFYLASNIAPHNDKIRSYLRDLEPVIAMRPDALIMSDPGLIMMVREKWPDQTIHLSVQANAVNWASVKFWESQGVKRVILSRELSLDEIEDIRQHCPDIELEVFVHGALCIAYSGRCLLSGYMTHRDSNQGACTNSCRWEYNSHEAKENETGELIAVDSHQTAAGAHQTAAGAHQQTASQAPIQPPHTFDPSQRDDIVASGIDPRTQDPSGLDEVQPMLLQEKSRPGEYMPAYEDEHGTYIMNSKDLRAVQHVERLAKMGIHSLKIEGRTKSHYYAARTAQVYRKAIDDAAAGRPFNMDLMGELEHLANRGYTEGFYRRHVPSEYQNYETGNSVSHNQQFVGEANHYDAASGMLTLEVKNRFAIGDSVQLMTPQGNLTFNLEQIENLKGQAMDVAPGSGHTVKVPMPDDVKLAEDGGYAMLMRNF